MSDSGLPIFSHYIGAHFSLEPEIRHDDGDDDDAIDDDNDDDNDEYDWSCGVAYHNSYDELLNLDGKLKII